MTELVNFDNISPIETNHTIKRDVIKMVNIKKEVSLTEADKLFIDESTLGEVISFSRGVIAGSCISCKLSDDLDEIRSIGFLKRVMLAFKRLPLEEHDIRKLCLSIEYDANIIIMRTESLMAKLGHVIDLLNSELFEMYTVVKNAEEVNGSNDFGFVAVVDSIISILCCHLNELGEGYKMYAKHVIEQRYSSATEVEKSEIDYSRNKHLSLSGTGLLFSKVGESGSVYYKKIMDYNERTA